MRGEDDYFSSVYEQTYRDMLRYVVMKTRNAADVEDIMQNAYAKFYKRLQRRGHADILDAGAFMMGVVQRELNSYYRFRIIRAQREQALEEGAPSGELCLEDRAVTADLLRRVWKELERAPLMSYKCFVLHCYFGMSAPDIAQALGLTEPGVTSRLYRTRQALRQRLGKEL